MKEHIALSVQRERRCFLVVGGKDSNDVLKYDTAMKKSTVLTPLNKKRSSACLARVGNYVYSIGGKVIWGSEVTDMVERLCYDDISSSWENMASMNEKRCVAGAATIHDTIFVTGGVNETPVELSSAEYYNLAFDKWTPIARMNHTRGAHVVVAVDNCLYSGAGHCDRTYLSSMERYDPRVGSWEMVAPMEKGRRWPTATVVDGLIYVIGGDIGVRTDTRTVEIYDQRANAWFPGPGLIIDRSAAASCTVRGKIYVLGGVEENVTDTSVECYDPATEKWTAETNLPCFMLNLCVTMVTV
uniref:BACK domain-containing protein n=1 Tax=Ciona savignyi TaxID=51511 RepID=H2ZKJ3_CIOSA